MNTPTGDPLQSLPTPDEIRKLLAKSLGETRVLRQMLKAAESREKLVGFNLDPASRGVASCK